MNITEFFLSIQVKFELYKPRYQDQTGLWNNFITKEKHIEKWHMFLIWGYSLKERGDSDLLKLKNWFKCNV